VQKAFHFLSLSLTSIATGISVGHVLQRRGKAALSGPSFLDVQQVLLRPYGKALGAIEGGALLASGALLALVRRRRGAFLLTLTATVCNAGMIAVWAALIRPINGRVDGWRPESLPADWAEARDRWHALHAIRAALAGAGLAALIGAALADTAPDRQVLLPTARCRGRRTASAGRGRPRGR
jgi:hypothetical protein